ncbi:hypothetical protein [Streptomyces vilmorinianum]|uniref:hypothetical protein n=1 Tax=Streptomyces vilmorinianum TaxID=3051092 RepID=UPI0010FAFB72|nr:hypothetical protein [Streptomyces vilmorinianum]
MSTGPAPAHDPVLTGEFIDTQVIYRCRVCDTTDFAFSVVAGHHAPARMPHEGCPAARAGSAPYPRATDHT